MIFNATCPSLNCSHFELATNPNDMNKTVVVHVYIESDIQKYYLFVLDVNYPLKYTTRTTVTIISTNVSTRAMAHITFRFLRFIFFCMAAAVVLNELDWKKRQYICIFGTKYIPYQDFNFDYAKIITLTFNNIKCNFR